MNQKINFYHIEGNHINIPYFSSQTISYNHIERYHANITCFQVRNHVILISFEYLIYFLISVQMYTKIVKRGKYIFQLPGLNPFAGNDVLY